MMPGLESFQFPADAALPLPPHYAAAAAATDNKSASAAAAGAAPVPSHLRFVLNKKKVSLASGSFDPDLTLLEYLRNVQGLTGTKLGCAEGGCGACSVVLGKVRKRVTQAAQQISQDADETYYEYRAVNACLLPMVAIHGCHVLTVEGIGTVEEPHPVQERIAKLFGSQCGFCTPGIVMALYATIRTAHALKQPLTELQIERSLDGNLCRCTGYRPILDAAKTFATASASTQASSASSSSSSADSPSSKATTPEELEDQEALLEAAGRNACPKGDECCRVKKDPKKAGCAGTMDHYAHGGLGGAGEASARAGDGSGRLDTDVTTKPKELTGFKPYRFEQEIIFPPHLLKAGASFDEQDLAFASPSIPDSWYRSEADEEEEAQGKRSEPERRTLWLRPGSLSSLIESMRFYARLADAQGLPASLAKVRAGNTETGIEVKFKHSLWSINVFVSDHLSELAGFSAEASSLKIGANISLQTIVTLLREQKDQQAGTASAEAYSAQVGSAILSNLSHFAGTQIRNVATLAGNIATASPISDLNPVWVAANARVDWVDPAAAPSSAQGSCSMREFFKGYRKTALPQGAILTQVSVPLEGPSGTPPAAGERRFIRAYKQAKRKDDDIAIVNGCLYASVAEDGTLNDVCLVYGGMAPTTAIARKTCDYLLGKRLGDEATLKQALEILSTQDFDLPYTVPGGMPAYRKALALGFLARFWADITAEAGVTASTTSSLALAELPHSEPDRSKVTQGSQDLEGVDVSTPATKSVGKSLPHLSALKQVTGEANYVDDIPRVQNEAYGALIMSTKARAKILSIDASAALQIPGVVDIITVKDIPPKGSNIWSPPAMDEPMFADGEVFTIGQTIGVVVAEDKKTAQRAAKAVRVEYEDLPHILTIDEAIAAESFFKARPLLLKGDGENEDWSDCDHVLDGETRLGGQEHFYFETNAVLAIPGKEDQELEIFSSTQNPSETQSFCASLLGVPNNRVVVRTKRLGGGFGGKESRPVAFAAVMALAARKTGRPVRSMMDRDEDMAWSGQRHPFKAAWRVGYSSAGKLLRLDATVYNNGGWSQDLSQAVLERAMTHIDQCCSTPHMRVRGFICKTNTVSNTAFRAFGGQMGGFTANDILAKVAASLNIRSEDLVERNFYKEGELTHYGQAHIDWNVPALWDELKASSDFERRKAEVDAWNKQNRWKKRGICLLPSKFGISFTALMLNQASCLIHIYAHDGSVFLSHGGTEMGQGLHTKMAQVAATELRIPIDKIHISETNTQHAANTSATAASASSDLNGMAIKDACQQINERLDPFRTDPQGNEVTFEKACHDAYFARVSLSATGHYKTPDIGYDWIKRTGNMFFYYTQGVAVSEVEVDLLTGDHLVRRADIHMDIGRSINPAIDVGQVEGAFVQAIGLFTIEESLWLPSGKLFNNGPGNYKIPAFLDTPQDMRVSFMRGKNHKIHHLRTIQSSKGVGEPPLLLGASVFFALRNAIASARADAGLSDDGRNFQFFSPATPEKIRNACVDEIAQLAAKGTEKKSASDKPFFLPIY